MKQINWLLLLAELLWEIPLAFLSFLFFKLMKFVIGNIVSFSSRKKQSSFQWRILSEDILKNPMVLPWIMTQGPRWNTHAITAFVGQLDVKETIALDVKSADNSTQSWFCGIYSNPDGKMVDSLGSIGSNFDEQWKTLKLPPGKYTLALRYYNWFDQIKLPGVKVDDVEVVNSTNVSTDVNNFYQDLSKKTNLFYLVLHFYIYTILRLRKWLPESFIRKEYLPVGAADTNFFYGHIRKEESLQLELDEKIFNDYEVFLSLYNRASFPVKWYQIKEEKYKTEPSENNGFYLLRVRKNSPGKDNLINDWVKIETVITHQ